MLLKSTNLRDTLKSSNHRSFICQPLGKEPADNEDPQHKILGFKQQLPARGAENELQAGREREGVWDQATDWLALSRWPVKVLRF